MPHERLGGSGLASRRVDDVQELDARDVVRRQALPADPALEIDRAPLTRSLNERAAVPPDAAPHSRTRRRLRRSAVPRERLALTVLGLEDLVERDAELADDGVERPDGRLDPPRLDLGDEARRHLERPRQRA